MSDKTHREVIEQAIGKEKMAYFDDPQYNNHFRSLDVARLNFITHVLNRRKDKTLSDDITSIQCFVGEVDLQNCNNRMYELCEKLWDKTVGYDSGSSQTHHANMWFVYHVCMYMLEAERDNEFRKKQEKLASLERQAYQLRQELSENV